MDIVVFLVDEEPAYSAADIDGGHDEHCALGVGGNN